MSELIELTDDYPEPTTVLWHQLATLAGVEWYQMDLNEASAGLVGIGRDGIVARLTRNGSGDLADMDITPLHGGDFATQSEAERAVLIAAKVQTEKEFSYLQDSE